MKTTDIMDQKNCPEGEIEANWDLGAWRCVNICAHIMFMFMFMFMFSCVGKSVTQGAAEQNGLPRTPSATKYKL